MFAANAELRVEKKVRLCVPQAERASDSQLIKVQVAVRSIEENWYPISIADILYLDQVTREAVASELVVRNLSDEAPVTYWLILTLRP